MSTQRHFVGASAVLALALLSHADAQQKIALPIPFQGDVKTPPIAASKEADVFAAPTMPRELPSQRSTLASTANAVDVFADGVLFDTTDSGLWAASRGWKANFAGDTTTFMPFFGSKAPRNFPLAFRVVDVTVGGDSIPFASRGVAHSKDSVSIERGAVDEAYALSASGLEQTFTIQEPVSGDVRVRIAVQGEYVGTTHSDGILFESELGSILYGRAFVVDAKGVKTPIETTFDGETIELRAPSSVLEHATYPVTIDPVISHYGVDVSTDVTVRPDVAYDATTNQYLHVFERVFSAVDSDLFSYCADDSGVIDGTYRTIDVTSTRWAHPSVASNHIGGRFGVVAEVGAVGARDVEMRTFLAATRTYEAPFVVNHNANGEKFNPVIGGDPNSIGPTYFCVVWERTLGATDHDIHARLVTSDGMPYQNTILVDNSSGTLDTNPAISKSNGVGHYLSIDWTVAWEHEDTVTDHDIYGAQIHWDGVISQTTFHIGASNLDETNPTVSSILDGDDSPRAYIAAYEVKTISNAHNVRARSYVGAIMMGQLDLSGLLSNDLKDPSIDADGGQFLLSLARQATPSDYDIYAVTLYSAGLDIGQASTLWDIDTTNFDARAPAVTSKHSGGAASNRFAVAFERDTNSLNDIRAATVENPQGGPVSSLCPGTIATCPCGNGGVAGAGCANSINPNGGLLAPDGGASVSGDSFALIATGLPTSASCLFFQGTATMNAGVGTIFGDGLRCVNGTIVRLGTKTCIGGVATYPQGADVGIGTKGNLPASGGVRYYQVWYRNPSAYCTPASFNLTNALKAVWVP